jgi:hypothetical protein
MGIRRGKEKGLSPATVLTVTVSVLYLVLLLITPSYFDRYTLPLIALVVLLLAGHAEGRTPALAFVFAGLFIWLSVTGTKDYFAVNRMRWEAYNYLTGEKGVDAEDIHGGFETACWDSRKYRYIFGADVLEKQRYLIQYTPEKDFRLLRSYPFQRYLPFRRDTVNIYYRE